MVIVVTFPVSTMTPSAASLQGMVRQINEASFEYYARLARVRHHVDRSPARVVSLNEAAQIACLERKYFSAFFRAKIGIPFTEWQTSQRIRRAVDLLRSRDDSVSHVARATGFSCTRTFERAFKRWVGTTPLQFKLRVRP